MPKLYVVPHDVVDMLKDEGIPLTVLANADQMAQQLSAHDMADIHYAIASFPFQFSDELGIELGTSPFHLLQSHEKYEDVYNRVKESVDTKALTGAATDKFILSYTLNPVDENIWVAVLQRQHSTAGDPGRLLLSSNQSFFDGLIAQVLHTFSFEKLCATNLFTYYLGSLTPHSGS